MTTRVYPPTVSRTLDPADMGFTTVIGQHDRRLTDADINLIQDIQDLKRLSILNWQAPSGCLSMTPFDYRSFDERVFYIPAFDVLFRGEVIRVGGHGLADRGFNRIELASPRPWVPGMIYEDARIFVVFLEMWGKVLDPQTGNGYYIDPTTGELFFYPLGCVGAAVSGLVSLPDNVIDPFQNVITTLRLQIQWRLRVEPLPSLAYDFENYRYGLDKDSQAGAMMYGRGSISSLDPASEFAFDSLVATTGEPCLWRAGSGDALNRLGTIDGYTYAMPIATVFQRNQGVYSHDINPFGCAASGKLSGLASTKISGRPDGRFSDIIYAEDVIDTRLSVSLTGYDPDILARQGISDVFSGAHTSKISRGETPGCKATAMGALLPYTVAVSNTQIQNVHTVGAFDGYMNGFSSDARVFYTTRVITLTDRATVGTHPTPSGSKSNDNAWGSGDVVALRLDNQTVQQGACITDIFIQSFSNASDGSKTPIALYGGQLQIDGLNTRQVTLRVIPDLGKLTLQPGANPLVVTLAVKYPAGTGMDTQRVPVKLAGGEFKDNSIGKTLLVIGVSDYEVSANLPPTTAEAVGLVVYNPFYSAQVFGTRVQVRVKNSLAATSTGADGLTLNTFSLNRLNLDRRFTGLYTVGAQTLSGEVLPIFHREIVGSSIVTIISGDLDAGGVTDFTILCHSTSQLAFSAPVRGITAIEETVIYGSLRSSGSSDLTVDPRITTASITYGVTGTVIVCYARNGKLKGFSGNDISPLIWVSNAAGKFAAYPCTTELFGGIATITVPGINLVGNNNWFLATSFLPTPGADSQLILTSIYVPYQGEGVQGRDYTVVYTPDDAFVTTNGTGSAPVVGLQDVFPFNRQFPIAPTLPSLASWSDAELKNQAMAGDFDGNYTAKQFNNIGHTFLTKLYTNDFISPINGFIRRKIRMITKAGQRGFSKALPHVGFAIKPPQPKSVLGNNLQTTGSAITLFVHNISGNNVNDGLSNSTAKKTIHGALAALPPVIRHPVSIVLIDTGYAYSIKDLAKSDFTSVQYGGGRQTTYYCLGNMAFVMQEAARISIGRAADTGERISIDATGFMGFGDGPMYAFLVSDSRVIFQGISFKGFTSAAVKSIDSDVEFVDCELNGNLVGVSAEQGSQIVFTNGIVALGSENIGCILASSSLTVAGTTLKVAPSSAPGAFFVAERGSNMNFQNHSVDTDATLEVNVLAKHVVAQAETSSTVTCDPTWVSNGCCKLRTNSTLVRSLSKQPFKGVLDKDSSSNDAPIL